MEGAADVERAAVNFLKDVDEKYSILLKAIEETFKKGTFT